MAAGIVQRRGRPRYVAVIEHNHDPARFYYDRFLEACQTFSYREMVALSRKLGCSLRTVYRWKNGEKFPRIGRILTVLDWTRLGKPVKLETQTEIDDKRVFW